MNEGATGKTLRRRRTWYRRRLRTQRMLVAVIVGVTLTGVCWQSVARHFSLPKLHAAQLLPDSFWIRGNIRKDLALMAARSIKPKKSLPRLPAVYPYSVVPGGIKDPGRSSLCGVAGLRGSRALRGFRLQPCSTGARRDAAGSLSFVSDSGQRFLDAEKSSAAYWRAAAHRWQDHGASSLRQPGF